MSLVGSNISFLLQCILNRIHPSLTLLRVILSQVRITLQFQRLYPYGICPYHHMCKLKLALMDAMQLKMLDYL